MIFIDKCFEFFCRSFSADHFRKSFDSIAKWLRNIDEVSEWTLAPCVSFTVASAGCACASERQRGRGQDDRGKQVRHGGQAGRGDRARPRSGQSSRHPVLGDERQNQCKYHARLLRHDAAHSREAAREEARSVAQLPERQAWPQQPGAVFAQSLVVVLLLSPAELSIHSLERTWGIEVDLTCFIYQKFPLFSTIYLIKTSKGTHSIQSLFSLYLLYTWHGNGLFLLKEHKSEIKNCLPSPMIRLRASVCGYGGQLAVRALCKVSKARFSTPSLRRFKLDKVAKFAVPLIDQMNDNSREIRTYFQRRIAVKYDL